VSLTPGARLGVYDIIAAIGEGGMGQVFRATDTKLKRHVAIKILPPSLAADADRLARFQREAEVLASLNHPHIAAIYGLEESHGIAALVMELVEGDDLSQRIARGALPLDEALPVAKQIAEALEAAHEQGIIHRDLKPANIKVRPDGTVKVLDFGLAKAMDPPVGSSPNVSHSPTITTPAMTQAGMILGTAAYMAPEQAKGRPVDRRADVWAFGAVLFEMLTAQRAFAGEDVSDTLANVLKMDPAWERLPADLPPRVRQVLRACLQKNAKQRLGDMQDVRLALDGAFETAGSQVVAQAGAVTPPWRRALPVAAAVVLTAAIVGGAAWRLRPAPAAPAPVAQFSIAVPDGAVTPSIAMSPDGTRIAFGVRGVGLYLRAIGDVEAHLVPGVTPGLSPTGVAFSPDGESVVFYSIADGSLKRIPVAGGQALTIAQGFSTMSGLTWGEGGIVFGQDAAGVFRVSPNGGKPEPLATVEAGEVAYGPQVLPGGKFVMFTVASNINNNGVDRWDTAHIVVQSLASGERRTIINGGADARYLPTGHVIYAVAGTVFAVAFDSDTLTVRGNPVAVVTGVRRGADGSASVAVSNSGSLLFVPGPVERSIAALRIPTLARRNAKTEPLALLPGQYRRPRVSPDGKRLAVGIDEGASAEVWIYDLSGTTAMRRLTFGGRNRFPVWSSDGRRLAFQSDRDGTPSIYVQNADGGGAAERLTTAAQGVSQTPDSWSPDGRTLLFSEQEGDTFTLMAFSVSEQRAVTFGGVQSLQPADAVFSPDGRWVAYASSPVAGGILSADRGIFVQPFPATGATYQVPKTRLDFHPTWAPSGREIFYVPTISVADLTAVSVQILPSLTFGPPATVAGVPQPAFTSQLPRGYDVLPDGSFLTLVPADNASSGGAGSEMRVILNWFEELKRLVPR
jgi:eukaryotic-like serine/threonine-protein kinase